MQVYIYPKSRSLRVLWVLEELGESYETISVDLLSTSPAITSPHPRGKVPFLVDGDITLAETLAICIYLCEKKPNNSLYSQNFSEKAQINAWISFALTDLESPVWSLLKHSFLLPEQLKSEAVIKDAKRDAESVIAGINYDGQSLWVTGNHFSLADIFMSHTLMWAQLCGVTMNATLEAYIKRATSRAAYHRAQTRNNHL